MAQPTLLVLAAGMGSRYGGLKQIDPIGPSDETILDYSVYDAIRAGFDKAVFVIRRAFEAEIVKLYFGRFGDRIKLEFVPQELDMIPEGFTVPDNREKPWGTAHAVLVTEPKINGPLAVINADDFYGADAFKVMYDFLASADSRDSGSYCMVGYCLGNTLSEHGHVSRGVCETDSGGLLTGITERTKIEQTADGIFFEDENGNRVGLTGEETVSMNMWGFTTSVFDHFRTHFEKFLAEQGQNPKAESYIPTAVNELMAAGLVTVKVLPGGGNWFGVTYKEDKATAERKIREMIAEGQYPDNLWG